MSKQFDEKSKKQKTLSRKKKESLGRLRPNAVSLSSNKAQLVAIE